MPGSPGIFAAVLYSRPKELAGKDAGAPSDKLFRQFSHYFPSCQFVMSSSVPSLPSKPMDEMSYELVLRLPGHS